MTALERGMQVTLSGVERYKQSALRGMVVCPAINLWLNVRRSRKAGTLSHDTPVKIKRVKKGPDGRTYYQVVGADSSGKDIRGWVSWPFIKEADPTREPGGENYDGTND